MARSCILVAAMALAHMAAAPAFAGDIERVSVGLSGSQADGSSFQPALAADGSLVAFLSAASNLVPGDTNRRVDVFVRDRRAGTTHRVNLGPGGSQADGDSFFVALSPDGRFVAFDSSAGNLVPGDINGCTDIFVHDRRTGRTERVSVGPGGVAADANSFAPSLGAGGRYVAFQSEASNLVPGDTNATVDVFLRDRRTGVTERVNLGPGGVQADFGGSTPALSADGRFVAFISAARNLVPGDTNFAADVFVHDRLTRRTERVSVGRRGTQADERSADSVVISARGQVVAFGSEASNLVPGDTNGTNDVFVRDRRAGVTRRASVSSAGLQTPSGGFSPALTPDGRFVAFASGDGGLVPGDTNGAEDIFLRDRRTRRTERVSVGTAGTQAGSFSIGAALSADGRIVAFTSFADNLVPGDTNGTYDVFLRTR